LKKLQFSVVNLLSPRFLFDFLLIIPQTFGSI